mgnify:CR=1 FL=1
MGRPGGGRVQRRRPGGIFSAAHLFAEIPRSTTFAFERDDLTGFRPDEHGLGGPYPTGISLGGTYMTIDQGGAADEHRPATTSASARATAT